LRGYLKGLSRYITTVETSKHRFFVFLDQSVLPDNKLIAIALDDAYHLGILSSRIHLCWTLANGSTLEDRPVYVKTRCFETFPFPISTDAQKARIRDLAERLDAHRKRQQAQYPKLTMTGMYNVLEKLRAGETLNAKDKDKEIHTQGLVSVLKQLHDEIDAAVADAYGWPQNLSDEEILERLVALNAERAAEEQRDLIRWLRPDYQNQAGTQPEQAELFDESVTVAEVITAAPKQAWPKTLAEQVQATRAALGQALGPLSADIVARQFNRARTDRVAEILETLAALGQVQQLDDGRYSAR
jgi:hypothetical protein